MNPMKKIPLFLSLLILIAVLAFPTGSIEAYRQTVSTASTAASASCHFGINVVKPLTGFDLSTLGVGNYMDWWLENRDSTVPAGIDYYRVLSANDLDYPTFTKKLPTLVTKYPGSTWIIGNEPDSEVTYQDHLSAETYAQRFFEFASVIRQKDPTAKIGFGQIMMPTPIRIHYLTLAMNRLAELAGGMAQAHALIDIYTIHAYIMNETELYGPDGSSISWGAGLPIGYDPTSWPAPESIRTDLGETYKTYDINIFKSRLMSLRQWIVDQGEQKKPLWITEFGVLFPSVGNPYFYASDADTANFMAQTYDFMLGYKDPQLGLATDDNRLVQKWTWFSLNLTRTTYGGSLFDPSTQMMTAVGQEFIQYNPSIDAVPVINPDVYVVPASLELKSISTPSTTGQVSYQVTLKVSNNISSDRHTTATVDLYDGATLIGSNQVDLPRCGGTAQVTFIIKNLVPGEVHNFTAQADPLPGNGSDTNLGNNRIAFAPIALLTPTNSQMPAAYFPIVLK